MVADRRRRGRQMVRRDELRSRVRETNGRSQDRAMDRFDRTRHSKGGNKPGEVRPQMQEAMQSHFSVFRRGDTLQQVIVSYVG
jgi:succinate dehydrogenase/fumarate reductase flavoprotein subunit